MGQEPVEAPGAIGQPFFATTHWSVVLAAAEEESPQAATALDRLCRTYWYPIYAYIRKQGYSPDDAQDLTQGFFAHILSRGFLKRADPNKGRFRSFVLGALRYFLADEWARFQAQKRGGGKLQSVIDTQVGEAKYQREAVDQLDAENIFERRWALALLDRVLERLQKDFQDSGKNAVFDALRGFLIGERGPVTYAEAATKLGMTEGAVKVTVHRMRQRYRELFREEVSHTVDEPAALEDEVRHIFAVLTK